MAEQNTFNGFGTGGAPPAPITPHQAKQGGQSLNFGGLPAPVAAGMGGSNSPYMHKALGGMRGQGAYQTAGDMGVLGGGVSPHALFRAQQRAGLGVTPGAVPGQNAVMAARAQQFTPGQAMNGHPAFDPNDPKNAVLGAYR